MGTELTARANLCAQGSDDDRCRRLRVGRPATISLATGSEDGGSFRGKVELRGIFACDKLSSIGDGSSA